MGSPTENMESDVIIEMIEIYVNAILYKRKLYPEAVFRVRKAYNIPVYISVYESLNSYIAKTLQTARELKRMRKLHRLAVVILSKEAQPLERYVFELEHRGFVLESDEHMINFEEELRKSLLSLDSRMKDLAPLPDAKEATFKIYLQCTESASAHITAQPRLSSFPFVRVDIASEPVEKSKIELLPVVHTKNVGISIFVEEHKR
ncbi:DNA polymerase zeta subunit 2 [Anopheles bellator]|uniref:DNA polymerase zeta subunit 2 n=1 Tax=Anopheles bellator TaxID=139047 RepID=UPI00264748E9|nr:DNA polymerase zeta subunit 2 [Anopheles bellator]